MNLRRIYPPFCIFVVEYVDAEEEKQHFGCLKFQKSKNLLTKRLNDDIIIKLSGTESAEEENSKSFLEKVLDKLKTV